MADVSVVIPLYNKASHIVETIESAQRQTHQPTEILVADDGSTDGGATLVESMNDPRIKIIRTAMARSGPSAARNLGIWQAKSDWIALLDADDTWETTHLASLTRLVERDQQLSCAFCSWQIVYPDGRRSQDACGKQIQGDEVFDFDAFLALWLRRRSCPMWTSATLIRRAELIAIGGFPSQYRRGEDKATWLRLMERGRGTYSSVPTAHYNKAVVGQESSRFEPFLHPVVLVAERMIKETRHPQATLRKLQRVSNLVTWQYARQAAFRRPIPDSFLDKFYWREGFASYLALHIIRLFDFMRFRLLQRRSA